MNVQRSWSRTAILALSAIDPCTFVLAPGTLSSGRGATADRYGLKTRSTSRRPAARRSMSSVVV
jgi:hypothetical protein